MLEGRLRWALRFPSFPFIAQFELGQEASDLRRNEVARKIEEAVGLHAVEDFVTPPPVSFAKGSGHLEIARTTVRYSSNDGIVVHFSVKSSTGSRVEVCLFGSMDNTPTTLARRPQMKQDGHLPHGMQLRNFSLAVEQRTRLNGMMTSK